MVRFSVYDPLYCLGDEMFLNSSLPGLEAVRMEKKNIPEGWLSSKYGKPVSVWQCDVEMKSANGDAGGQYQKGYNVCFNYSYMKRIKGQYNTKVVERQPERAIYLRDPHTYRGEIGNFEHSDTFHWHIQDDVNIVNGHVEKADGTFLEGFFFN